MLLPLQSLPARDFLFCTILMHKPHPNNELKGYQVQGIRALVSYEGTNALELVEDFHAAVDYYLDGTWYEP